MKEESLFKADAVNEEDPERDLATQEEEEEEDLFKGREDFCFFMCVGVCAFTCTLSAQCSPTVCQY